ncbi:amidohydrolase family protein [Henriciella litoralis]|uniref:amidohydrolase family protein n=1 Tax=Henriciella litoralis TaxID=568102 RepID=UPI00146C0945|nr:amidohydrolase family protein [Henriciella litoralis]
MRLFAILSAAVSLCFSPALAQTLAITNAKVMTAGEAGELESATILIENGRFTAVGADVRIPADARMVDMNGKVITPGLIVSSTTLGAVEINDRANANDIDASSSTLSAGADIQYAINPNSTLIPVARRGGVARAIVTPGLEAKTGGAAAFGGQAALISTAANGDAISQPQVAMTLNLLGSDQGRAAVFPQLKAMLEDASSFAENPSPERVSSFKAAKWTQADLQGLVPVMRAEIPLYVAAERASDIRAFLKIAAPYNLRIVFVGAAEAWSVADEIAAAGASVVLDPYENLPQSFNAVLASSQNAVRLHEAGVPVLIVPPRAGHDARLIRYRAGVAVAAGLPKDAALVAITSGPARMLGLDNYGEIAPGKVADMAIWSGDPFEPLSGLDALYIDGVLQPLEDRQTALRDKYRAKPAGK